MTDTRIFRYARLALTPEGGSHFHDEAMPLTAASFGHGAYQSDPLPVTAVQWVERDGPYFTDWHPAPRRQFVVVLEGLTEITASDGETRRFAPGEVVLVEDVTGKGHQTRNISDSPWRVLFIGLDPIAVIDPPPASTAPAYTSLFADTDGAARFRTIELPTSPRPNGGRNTVPLEAKRAFFRLLPPDYAYERHTAPGRQLAIILNGAVDLIGRDETRRFAAGGVVLAEDTTGEGHISRAVYDQERMSIFVRIAD